MCVVWGAIIWLIFLNGHCEENNVGGQELKQENLLEGCCSNQDGRWCRFSWDGKTWQNLGYILKEESIEFPNGLGMGYVREEWGWASRL